MKKMLAVLLLGTITCYGQTGKYDDVIENGKYLGIMPWVNNSITYTEIVELDSSAKKEELYVRAKHFFVDYYKSARDVIQLDDKDNGEVDGKGNLSVTYQITFMTLVDARVDHSVKIFVKDGKYKYEISDLSIHYRTSGSTIGTSYVSGHSVDSPLEDIGLHRKANSKKLMKSIDIKIQLLIAGLKDTMSKKLATKADW